MMFHVIFLWWTCGKKRNAEIVICETCVVNICVHHFKLYCFNTTLVEDREIINKDTKHCYKDKADKDKSDRANKANNNK